MARPMTQSLSCSDRNVSSSVKCVIVRRAWQSGRGQSHCASRETRGIAWTFSCSYHSHNVHGVVMVAARIGDRIQRLCLTDRVAGT